MLPPALVSQIEISLSQAGIDCSLLSSRPVSGGCIHQARRLDTTAGSFFLKWNTQPLAPLFSLEAHGLDQIRLTNTVAIPKVYGFTDPTPGIPGYILLEWIEPGFDNYDAEILGEQLGALHASPGPSGFGLDRDNLIGSSPQANTWEADWVIFFRDHRLRFQYDLARQNGLCPSHRQSRIEKLFDRLPSLIGGISRKPSLLHGDLWGGNVIGGQGARPYLIDPAIYYGDREADIAFTELFGGFSPRFYQAYLAGYPLEPGYQDRRDLYNLYHLLNHLNIFGASYGPQIDSILRRYIGG